MANMMPLCHVIDSPNKREPRHLCIPLYGSIRSVPSSTGSRPVNYDWGSLPTVSHNSHEIDPTLRGWRPLIGSVAICHITLPLG